MPLVYFYLGSVSFLRRESLFTEAPFCATEIDLFVYFPTTWMKIQATSVHQFSWKKVFDPGRRTPQSAVLPFRVRSEKKPLLCRNQFCGILLSHGLPAHVLKLVGLFQGWSAACLLGVWPKDHDEQQFFLLLLFWK